MDFINQTLGTTISSSRELTKVQASRLIDTLEEMAREVSERKQAETLTGEVAGVKTHELDKEVKSIVLNANMNIKGNRKNHEV